MEVRYLLVGFRSRSFLHCGASGPGGGCAPSFERRCRVDRSGIRRRSPDGCAAATL